MEPGGFVYHLMNATPKYNPSLTRGITMSGASLLANGITNAASAYTQVAGAYSGAKYMVRSQQAMDRMQENQADKMDRDVEFQRINGIAESNAQAASAAAQVKIQY
jgi:hypothetical protein